MLGRPFGMMRFNATLLRVANGNEASSKAVYYTAVTEEEESECMCVSVCVRERGLLSITLICI